MCSGGVTAQRDYPLVKRRSEPERVVNERSAFFHFVLVREGAAFCVRRIKLQWAHRVLQSTIDLGGYGIARMRLP
jgi:hypothetical protein